tara:strand:+ start:5384 stop:6151 length:768 start_codon:yes stop_codon:yes gene_type:complete
MVKVLIINKGGDIKEQNITKVSTDTFHKKCNFKNADGFEIRHTWNFGKFYVSLYARDHGNSNTVNKYDLPPPLDNDLYYGKMLLVKHDNKKISNDNIIKLLNEEWEKMYEMLFGGFEDLDSEEDEEETDEIPEHLKTKNGYMKDGFVVSDEEDDEDYIEEDNGDETEGSGDETEGSGDEVEDSEGETNSDNLSDLDSEFTESDEESDGESDGESDEESDEESDDASSVASELSEESFSDFSQSESDDENKSDDDE